MKEVIRDYKELRKKASNTKASSVGNSSLVYDDRVFMLLYFPEETKTPPCFMYFPKTMVVGKMCDRVGAMLKLPQDVQPKLVRLKTHETVAMSILMGDIGAGLHEEFVVTMDGVLPGYFPGPSEVSSSAVCEPEEVEEKAEEEVKEEVAVETTPTVGGGVPEEGLKWWSEVGFANKKYQPLGDKNTPAGKRLQFAMLLLSGPHQKAVYMHFNKDWVAGRMVDTSLQAASLPNPNLATTNPLEKLVPYNLRTLAVIPPSTPLAQADVQSGDAILVATAAGIPAWCAIEAAKYTNPEPAFEKEAKKKLRECVIQ
eukprot:TRINITY_DN28852_c0_g1_i1.p1 TRINITY_DN28852_c0_g1~~TRINITY_DN28852_c0_g1_i1.p1  ORF type:complete len:351 (+),score=95.76 TRINITY_DN28852_c0_g1_i1:119-1054(+)